MTRAKSQSKSRRYTYKFLSECKNPKTIRSVLQSAPDRVIKDISNTAHNILHNDKLKLAKNLKSQFSQYKKKFEILSNPKVQLQRKRSLLLNQRGGVFPFLPLLLKAGLTLLGSAIIGKITSSGNSSQSSPPPDQQ